MPKTFDRKTVELIAIGAAFALNCQKCMKVHKKEASDAGVTSAEMLEALSVASGVVAGAKGVTEAAAAEIFGAAVEDIYTCCPAGSECCA